MLKVYIEDVSGLCLDGLRLSAQRMEKLARLSSVDDKRLCAGAELLLMRALELSSPPEYRFGEHGKPYIVGCPNFSLSHSGKYVLCAVSDTPVGADIEAPRPDSMKLARRFFTLREQALVKSDNDFCRIWVQKESYAKALGTGLAQGLASFDVSELADCTITTSEHDGYHIAVCKLKN